MLIELSLVEPSMGSVTEREDILPQIMEMLLTILKCLPTFLTDQCPDRHPKKKHSSKREGLSKGDVNFVTSILS